MSHANERSVLAQARTRRSRRVSAIWTIPLVAVALGAWLAWQTVSKRGPEIAISFETAEGLQAGQSQLRFKDIVIGTVKSLALTPDRRRVIVTVATTREADDLLTEKTEFWVVKPRLFAGNVSGLETLLSGAYIGMRPGPPDGAQKRDFVGLENPPVLDTNVPGQVFLLKAAKLGSISLGSPVFFRDLTVGEVLGWDIADMVESVTIHAFVRAPFDSYVNDQTRFWNASGVSVKLGGTGVEVQLESLRALLLGGIAFESPREGAKLASGQTHDFPLFSDRDAAAAASYSRSVNVITYFKGSVRGLAPGAEVSMHGLKVGTVTDVQLAYDPASQTIVAPVRFQIQPERILGVGARAVFPTVKDAANEMMKRGLRTKLESASLITGQQVVSLVFVPDAPPISLTMEAGDFVLPSTEGGGLGDIQTAAAALLDKVNSIPFAQIGKNLDGALHGLNDLTNGTQTNQVLEDLAATMSGLQTMVKRLDNGVTPVLRQLPEISAGLQKSLTSATRLMQSLDSAYGDNTKFNRDVDRLLLQLSDAVRAIRSLADMLSRNPESLIKGRPGARTE